MRDDGEQARALAKDIVQQWFSRSLGTMHGWEKWKPIWEEQLTEQFTKEFRQVERETWEKAADELQSRYNRTWDISPFVLSFIAYCRQQAKECA